MAKDFDTTAWVFTVYSISYIMASIITGFIFPKITRFDRKIIVMGVPLVLAGGVWTLVPEVTNFYSLVCVYIVTGKILLRFESECHDHERKKTVQADKISRPSTF